MVASASANHVQHAPHCISPPRKQSIEFQDEDAIELLAFYGFPIEDCDSILVNVYEVFISQTMIVSVDPRFRKARPEQFLNRRSEWVGVDDYAYRSTAISKPSRDQFGCCVWSLRLNQAGPGANRPSLNI